MQRKARRIYRDNSVAEAPRALMLRVILLLHWLIFKHNGNDLGKRNFESGDRETHANIRSQSMLIISYGILPRFIL